jgi:transposase-like protein
MSVGKPRDPKLERRWRDLIARWKRSGISVSDFCIDQGVSESSFYAWKRELAARDQAVTPTTTPMPTFVPVRVASTAAIEIVLTSGVVVRVPVGADLLSVAQLVAALEATPC